MTVPQSADCVLLCVTAIIMLTKVLYSLENHFWAAQACLLMLIALLLFAHTILRVLGW